MTHNTQRLYHDLSWLWPMWGDPDGEYAVWCTTVTRLIESYAHGEVRTLLDMGCGGGKNAHNLKRRFQVTGIDISQPMLDLARKLNPECTFLSGDMRDGSFGQRFDAILIDDAISYMASRAELAAVFGNAYRHLRAGGVMVVSPDDTRESFRQNHTAVSHAQGSARPDHVDVVFVENYYDPDPGDETCEGTLIYLIREGGRLRVETDHHLLGLFSLQVWRETLREAGFEIHEEQEVYQGRETVNFACVRPG